jgi:hypothetical protein
MIHFIKSGKVLLFAGGLLFLTPTEVLTLSGLRALSESGTADRVKKLTFTLYKVGYGY